MKKIENLVKETEVIKKEPNKNYRTEKYSNRNKNLIDGLNNRADGTQNQ